MRASTIREADDIRHAGERGGLSRRQLLALLAGSALAPLGGACSDGCSGAADRPPADASPARSLPLDSLGEVARLIESKQVSPVELTKRLLDRIAELDGRLHSYITVTGEEALVAAGAAEAEIAAGRYRGPLHGVPVAVKDLCYTRDVRTTGGQAVLADFIPSSDATVVSRLREAGAILLGKLGMSEGAMGGYHPDFEVPVNPWNADRWAGVSSSGCGVATAAGLCFAAIGSDTGGSIRLPSAASGIVGLKPTYGRISRHGVLPLAETLDHLGPMVRRTADAAIVLQAVAGPDPNDPTTLDAPLADLVGALDRGVAGVRIGFDPRYGADAADPGVLEAIEAALERLGSLGAEIVEITLPEFSDALQGAAFTILLWEARSAHAASYPSRAREYGAYLREFLALGEGMQVATYDDAMRQRDAYRARLLDAFSDVDAVALPVGRVAFDLSGDAQYGGMGELNDLQRWDLLTPLTSPANLSGVPALCLPCGVAQDGLPLSMQLMAGPLREGLLCRVGHAYEEATEWHTRHPPL